MARTRNPAFLLPPALLGAASLLLASATAAAEPPANAETGRGLHTTTFHTDRGAIEVHLPDDLAAGDTLSGTVVARPSGRGPAATRRNADRLEGYVVELEGQEAEVGAGAFTWAVPGAVAAATLVLRDRLGREVARSAVPVAPAPAPSTTAGLTGPPVGQIGRPVALDGAFDGRFETSRVTIGGREARLLAESPRRLVVESPPDVVGPTTLVVREGETTAELPFRNVRVSLSAPRTSLDRGETTTVTVEVFGLQGLEDSIDVGLATETPTVDLEGGATQTLEIDPSEVGPDGRWVATRELVARSVGPFGLSARVLTPEPPPGPVAQARPEPAPEPAPGPGPQPAPGPGGTGSDGESEEAPSSGPAADGEAPAVPPDPEQEAVTFEDVNDRLEEVIDAIEDGELDGEARAGLIEEVADLEDQALKGIEEGPGFAFEEVVYLEALIAVHLILQSLRSPEAAELSDERVAQFLRFIRDINDRMDGPLRRRAREKRKEAREAGPAGPSPAAAEPGRTATARYNPASGLLVVEVDGLPPKQKAVVIDPATGREIASGLTDSSGKLEIRGQTSRLATGTALEIRCGEEKIPVVVEG
ncbi:MAG TPA: hypothetical protein VM599_09785 [Thermoanaerobaculia bacterium]|nr:hypothetical protein [Thermoanaerobaculia bacterium]